MTSGNGFDRRQLLLGAMALPLVSLAGAGHAVAQDKPYRFVIMASITGPGAAFGTGMAAAARTAIDRLNAAGGVLGRKIEAVVVDTGSDPAKAAVLLQEEFAKERPVAGFSGGTTAEHMALAPLFSREKIPFFGVSDLPALADASKFPYYFSTQTSFEGFAKILADQLKAAGVKTVALLTGLDGTGEINNNGLPPALKAAGIEVVAAERFKPTDVDMTSQLRKMEAANPDILFVEASGAPSGYILQGLVRLGITRPVVVGKAMAASNLEGLVDAGKLPKVYIINHAISHRGAGGRGDSELVKANLPAFQANSGGKLTTALYIYSWGYDAPLIWAAAATRAKSVDGEKVKAELESWGKTPPTGTQFMTREDYPYGPDAHLPPPAASGYTFSRLGTLDGSATRESATLSLK
jgi:branched-chain amino acid transport system substrate-binding protein